MILRRVSQGDRLERDLFLYARQTIVFGIKNDMQIKLGPPVILSTIVNHIIGKTDGFMLLKNPMKSDIAVMKRSYKEEAVSMTQLKRDLKIAVVGAGAIGGICAVFIQKAGCDLKVVVRRKEHAQKLREQGIRVSGIQGEFIQKIDAVHQLSDLPPDRDLVLLGVKATALATVAEQLRPVLKPSAVVVSLQNGFCEEALADILGRDRVIGCVTGWGATMHSDTELEMTSLGDFIIGNIDNKQDDRLPVVQAVLDHVLESRISSNITGSLYSKLIINSCITSVGALCGLYLGQMLARKKARQIFLKIMEEAVAVAQAMKIDIEVFAGKLNYYTFLEKTGFFADLKQHLFLLVLGLKYRKLKSSSLQSLERGEATEIEYLTGFITGNGNRLNIATPVNDQVIAMVRQIEQGSRSISSANLDEIRLG